MLESNCKKAFNLMIPVEEGEAKVHVHPRACLGRSHGQKSEGFTLLCVQMPF